MQAGLHAVGVGARTLGVVTVLAVFAVLLAYSMLVFGIVVVQGFKAFGHA
jgi:hypothetical protein